MSPLSACGRGPVVEAWERAATAEVLPQRTGNSAPFSSAWIQLNWHPFRNHGKQLEVENKERKFTQRFPVGLRSTVFSQWERRETILMCKWDKRMGIWPGLFYFTLLRVLLEWTRLKCTQDSVSVVAIFVKSNKKITSYENKCAAVSRISWGQTFFPLFPVWQSNKRQGGFGALWWWGGRFEIKRAALQALKHPVHRCKPVINGAGVEENTGAGKYLRG